MPKARSSCLARIAIFMIQIYRNFFSNLMLQSCRFSPQCSRYAEESFVKHGFLRGGLLTAKRILRCQPFCQGGFDPVP